MRLVNFPGFFLTLFLQYAKIQNMKTLTCPHPNRPYYSLGKCKECYYLDYNTKKNNSVEGKAYWRAHNLKRDFDLTVQQYDDMLAFQNGVCALCGKPQAGGQRLAVDHKHDINTASQAARRVGGHSQPYDGSKVRGLLCCACNRVVGYLDNSEWMAKAVEYLRKYEV